MTLLRVVDHYIGSFKYKRQIAWGLGIAFGLGIVVLGYQWYQTSYNHKAQEVFADAMELFERAQMESTQSLWDEADRAFAQGYSLYARSSLAPYFIAFRAQIALRKNELQMARELMGNALKQMSKGMPFYEMYAIQYARMGIDSGMPEVEKESLNELKKLAQDSKNSEQGMAIYYTGLRFFESGDREQALASWTPLLEQPSFADSLWSQAAQAQLLYQA